MHFNYVVMFGNLVQIFQDDEEKINHCDQRKCAELRRHAVRNSTQYECAHVAKVTSDLHDGRIESK